jgi:hypothetical protein
MRPKLCWLLLLFACGETDTDIDAPGCATVPVCDNDPWCHFKPDVDGLAVFCTQDAAGNAWMLHVEATGIPDHAYSDPQGQIWDQEWSFDIPLEPSPPTSYDAIPCPEPSDQGNQLFGPKGIVINGVSIYYPLSIEYVDPIYPPDGYDPESLDYCDAHGAGGAYHYHVHPPCLYGVYQNGQLATGEINTGPTDPSIETSLDRGEWGKPSGVIGFSLEGYPVYGPYADTTGAAHTGLDACNGKLDANGDYGYYVTDTFPYMLGCASGGTPVAQTTASDWTCTTNPPAGAP